MNCASLQLENTGVVFNPAGCFYISKRLVDVQNVRKTNARLSRLLWPKAKGLGMIFFWETPDLKAAVQPRWQINMTTMANGWSLHAAVCQMPIGRWRQTGQRPFYLIAPAHGVVTWSRSSQRPFYEEHQFFVGVCLMSTVGTQASIHFFLFRLQIEGIDQVTVSSRCTVGGIHAMHLRYMFANRLSIYVCDVPWGSSLIFLPFPKCLQK